MFYCHKVIDETNGRTCNTQLKSDGADSRQEWCEEFYVCPKCGEEYTLRTDFKIQSKIIESQVLYNSKGEAVE